MDTTQPDFDALWDYDRPAVTEAAFRDVLAWTEGSASTAYRAELLTQIARAQGLQRRFDDARATLDEVAGLLVDGAPPRPQVRYLLERGRVLNTSGQPDAAHPLFVQAWELARESGEDALAVDAAHMVAIVASGDEQMAWNQRALDLAQRSPDPKARRWRGSLFNNIGWTYHEAGDYVLALDMFERALVCRLEEGPPEEVRVARWCVARGLRSLSRAEDALSIQRKLLAEGEPTGNSSGYVLEEMGECLLALGRADEARPYFARAYALLSQDMWLAAHEPERLARLHELSQLGARVGGSASPPAD